VTTVRTGRRGVRGVWFAGQPAESLFAVWFRGVWFAGQPAESGFAVWFIGATRAIDVYFDGGVSFFRMCLRAEVGSSRSQIGNCAPSVCSGQ